MGEIQGVGTEATGGASFSEADDEGNEEFDSEEEEAEIELSELDKSPMTSVM